MRRYRRNGTPIGFQKPYVVLPGNPPQVWEVDGCKEWEEVPGVVALEAMAGKFGSDFDPSKAVTVMPGADLARSNLARSNLTRSNLIRSNLIRANLSGANLRGAVFSFADLTRANLTRADLTSADLSYAYLSYADLSFADLRGADLSYANLSFADLRGADLRGADLNGAALGNAYRKPSDDLIPGWRVVNSKIERILLPRPHISPDVSRPLLETVRRRVDAVVAWVVGRLQRRVSRGPDRILDLLGREAHRRRENPDGRHAAGPQRRGDGLGVARRLGPVLLVPHGIVGAQADQGVPGALCHGGSPRDPLIEPRPLLHIGDELDARVAGQSAEWRS